jgi:ABC-type sugar transport system ATPase subunit
MFDEGESRLAVTPAQEQRLADFADRPLILGVRPECLTAGGGPWTTLRVHAGLVEPLGDRVDVHVSTKNHPHITCRLDARTTVKEGDALDMQVDMDRVHFFLPDGDGRNVSLPDRPA